MDCSSGASCNQRVGSATVQTAQPSVPVGDGSPALPPRPQTTTVSPPMYYGAPMSYNGGYGSYGGYGGYGGGYSGMYGGSYGGYGSGFNNNMNGSMASDIELQWRQAFSSVESIVRTCSSVTMMLDSTYFAVFNCFRTVVGLGEHFSGIKAQLGRVLQAFPFVRWALKLVRFLLRIVGLSHLLPDYITSLEGNTLGSEGEQQAFADVWASSNGSSQPPAAPGFVKQSDGAWSLVYFALVFGLPWLLWKLMSISVQNSVAKSHWFHEGTTHPVALAQYDFQSDSSEELSFLRGAKVHLAPLEQQPHPKSGWLLGTVDGKTFGMVPKNYLAPPTMANNKNNMSSDNLKSTFN